MTELTWHGPHTLRELVLDFDKRPPFEPGVYTITRGPLLGDGSLYVDWTNDLVLYAGLSKHLAERLGDLLFGVLRLSATGGWQFHGVDERLFEYCAEHGIDPLDQLYNWALADCPKCAEIALHDRVMPTVLKARTCGRHPKGDGND